MAVPYTFGSATAAIPLAQLDTNFATTITLGNTAIQLGNTVTTLNNMTLANVTVSSGNVTVTNANVTSITATSDSYISGLTVGKGAGSVSTNTAVGAGALASNSSGTNITVLGYQAGYSDTASYLTAVGYQAAYTNTTGELTVLGNQAAYTNTTGNLVGIGPGALYFNTTGSYNTAVGGRDASSYAVMRGNTTGSYNTAMGHGSLANNTTASYSTAVGYQAGYSTTTGFGANTFLGYQAGYNVTTGYYNTFVGQNAGYYITTGYKNTILGSYNGNQGGLDIRTASNYIVLSDGDGNPRGYFDGSSNFYITNGNANSITNGGLAFLWGSGQSYIALGHVNGTPSTSYYMPLYYNGTIIGGISQNGTTAITYATSSDYRLKHDIAPMTGALAKVAALKPVTYKWNSDDSEGEGFIAHELAEVCPSAVVGEKDAVDEDGNPKYQGIDTSFLVATLTAAIQELNAKFEAYKATHP